LTVPNGGTSNGTSRLPHYNRCFGAACPVLYGERDIGGSSVQLGGEFACDSPRSRGIPCGGSPFIEPEQPAGRMRLLPRQHQGACSPGYSMATMALGKMGAIFRSRHPRLGPGRGETKFTSIWSEVAASPRQPLAALPKTAEVRLTTHNNAHEFSECSTIEP
jgi:hypothetical protein